MKTIGSLFIIIYSILGSSLFAQSTWTSPTYGYSIEIPEGFKMLNSVGANIDFKASKGNNIIVIVVKTIPQEYSHLSIWDILGDLDTFSREWENGAEEYMDNPEVLKYGKTEIDTYDAFWFDYTTSDPKVYSKTYQTQKGSNVYTITFTCLQKNYNSYSPVWYRFKTKINL